MIKKCLNKLFYILINAYLTSFVVGFAKGLFGLCEVGNYIYTICMFISIIIIELLLALFDKFKKSLLK